MANKKYICPPTPATGAGTFSDNLVGLQLVAGGGLTQGNFQFTTSTNEKVNRNFITGVFSDPINLDSLGIDSITQSKLIVENNFKVYPNFDLSQVSNFTLYGSMVKRMSASITNIINFFPAALESTFMAKNYVTGTTAENISYDQINNETYFEFDLEKLRNPFEIDFTNNATKNLSLKELPVSPLRDMKLQYAKYSLYYKGNGYSVTRIVPTNSLTTGVLKLYVGGNPFSGNTVVYDDLVVRPNDAIVTKTLNEELDEVENYLLNRNISPIYTSTYKVPKESDDGSYYIDSVSLTWPLAGQWNLDIITSSFENYIKGLNDISVSFDEYKTNLIARFLTTGSFSEFDTIGRKMEKVLQIYGRSFDETQKYITALSFMTSVNYNVGNDIPSQLLKNFAQTLGWSTNISPISETNFLDSVFGQKNQDSSMFSGVAQEQTPDYLNYQYYRNLILNTSYLFKSKGTKKSIENLLKLIGAPDALIEFNEYVYLADDRIMLSQFSTQFYQISTTGTYVEQIPVLDSTNIFNIIGVTYTGFTTVSNIQDVNITIDEFPMDEFGYPTSPIDSESYYFQIGSGWFEQTPKHRAPEEVNLTLSTFTGNNPNYQTKLLPYTYGQEYLDRFRKFPFMNLGFNLTEKIDGNKSWVINEIGLRENLDGNYNAYYFTENDKLVVNVKNVDIFLNPAQGLVYDVWYMSQQYNYPIPNQGMQYTQPTPCDPYPYNPYPPGGRVDLTEIVPQPKIKTFFEFAQTFWVNMINVRNRQFSSNGKTGGYPTLESIYWRYLESVLNVNIQNDNFTYQTMIEYVSGLGDYWIRLIEQMVPATTIWNTGVKYENSIFHRQKFVWRRQDGCQIITKPNYPVTTTTTSTSTTTTTTNPCVSVTTTTSTSTTTTTTLSPNSFISLWQTTGINETITLPYILGGNYSGTIDWGDGNTSTNSYANRTHMYSSAGTYTVIVTGVLKGWSFGYPGSNPNSKKIKEIIQWGIFNFSNISNFAYDSFADCTNLSMSAVTDTLNTSNCIGLYRTFYNCTNLTTINNVNTWDTSNFISLNTAFAFSNFNDNINSWDVSNVTDMIGLFQYNTSFNSPLSGWNTSSVISMNGMFIGASSFDNDLNTWGNATSGVTDMAYMFYGATAFDQDIGSWDVSKVKNMRDMFNNATAFDQNIGGWNISAVTNFTNFMASKTPSTFSTTNLDAIYTGWSSLPSVQPNINISFGTANYTTVGGQAGKNILTGSPYNWIITDGGGV